MPDSTRNLLVVVPALNEEESVGVVVTDIRRALPGVACVVVDDGSTDATAAVATAAGATVLRLPYNLGVGGAMRTGFRYARDHGHDVVVQVDADGQHDPRFIPQLVAGLDEADIVIGARFAGLGDYAARGPRRWAMRMLARVVSAVARHPLSDVTSGFKAMGPRAVRLFAQTYPAEWLGDTVEALVIAARSGLRIAQRPVEMRERQAGEPSHGTGRATVYLLRAGIAVLIALLRPRTAVAAPARAVPEGGVR
ncbi:glycosyltransferase family 2 protein [Microbacterium sp. No. 7]|uniref:glycosyltransferase family 2 protein n=1 Tax=Microbacterium sp. No. 7 TaxID=1714373 RepID=UPI0006D14932|nr:glycosyltransferase family 2 protein [Microbacterium sp. No. 7]ALJ19378.1 glycosyl transferase family 2 [Microbacterium sp. No. 7]